MGNQLGKSGMTDLSNGIVLSDACGVLEGLGTCPGALRET
jgi:hypothetical protein